MKPALHRNLIPLALASFLATTLPFPATAESPSRSQARSTVMTQYGIVATSEVVASQAGAAILARGGNAVDAAIAANAALSVIEPMVASPGGDLFAIVYDAKTKKLKGLNASGWAPKGMTLEYMAAKGYKGIPSRGIDSATVPGAVAGWVALNKRYGKLPLSVDLAPAIALAKTGIVVQRMNAEVWVRSIVPYANDPSFAQVFMPGGKAPAVGQMFRDPDLAVTLRRIGQEGSAGFYQGPVAAAILKAEKDLHGPMQASDLTEYQPEWVDPISTTYHGWTVWEMPPNAQGIAALEMLNIMEGFPLAEWGHNSVKTLHAEIEAKKLAYADLANYIGDPRASQIPVDQLLSKQLATQRAALITDRAQCQVMPSNLTKMLAHLPNETTYLATVDRDGNEVSLIQSLSGNFGSGVVPPGTGFALQNRAGGFTLQTGHPNTLRPRTRPLHTIIPAFMSKGSQHIAFGIMGGFNQPQAHAQFVANIVDFHMSLQAAMGAARFTKRTFAGCDLMMENGVAPDVISALGAEGNQITVLDRFSQAMGRGNAVEHDDATGVNFGATDPRADGEAVPEQVAF